MSKEKLLVNLQFLAEILEINPPNLDKNNNCILIIDLNISIYFAYEKEKDQRNTPLGFI